MDSGEAPANVLVTCSLSEENLLLDSAMEEGEPLRLPTRTESTLLFGQKEPARLSSTLDTRGNSAIKVRGTSRG